MAVSSQVVLPSGKLRMVDIILGEELPILGLVVLSWFCELLL